MVVGTKLVHDNVERHPGVSECSHDLASYSFENAGKSLVELRFKDDGEEVQINADALHYGGIVPIRRADADQISAASSIRDNKS